MYNVTLITGAVGCSKTTLGTLICKFLACDPLFFASMDTSGFLKISRQKQTEAGIELNKMNDDQANGFILPGNTVMNSILENLKWLHEEKPGIHVILCGSPRSPEEVEQWETARKTGIVSYKAMLIRCTYPEVKQGVYNRILKGEIRGDDGPREVKKRWKESQKKTIPGFKLIPKNLAAETARSKSLLNRLYDTVNHMDIPDNLRAKWIRCLGEKSHPIHAAIREIEAVKAARVVQTAQIEEKEAAHHHASPSQHSFAVPSLQLTAA